MRGVDASFGSSVHNIARSNVVDAPIEYLRKMCVTSPDQNQEVATDPIESNLSQKLNEKIKIDKKPLRHSGKFQMLNKLKNIQKNQP